MRSDGSGSCSTSVAAMSDWPRPRESSEDLARSRGLRLRSRPVGALRCRSRRVRWLGWLSDRRTRARSSPASKASTRSRRRPEAGLPRDRTELRAPQTRGSPGALRRRRSWWRSSHPLIDPGSSTSTIASAGGLRRAARAHRLRCHLRRRAVRAAARPGRGGAGHVVVVDHQDRAAGFHPSLPPLPRDHLALKAA